MTIRRFTDDETRAAVHMFSEDRTAFDVVQRFGVLRELVPPDQYDAVIAEINHNHSVHEADGEDSGPSDEI